MNVFVEKPTSHTKRIIKNMYKIGILQEGVTNHVTCNFRNIPSYVCQGVISV